MSSNSSNPVSLKAFRISNGMLSASPVFQTDSNNLYAYPGANPSISANGNNFPPRPPKSQAENASRSGSRTKELQASPKRVELSIKESQIASRESMVKITTENHPALDRTNRSAEAWAQN